MSETDWLSKPNVVFLVVWCAHAWMRQHMTNRERDGETKREREG